MANEVRIQLTPEQKAKIKAATGKTMGEIRVTSLGNNLAVSTSQRTTSIGAQDLSSKDLSAKDLSAKDLRST